MNRNQNSYKASATQGKNSKTFFGLLKEFFATKELFHFDFTAINHEKLPIIYANIRV